MSDQEFVQNENIDQPMQKDWVKKLRFSRSFSAKLILSDDKTKEYYAAITTKLLSYRKVRSRIRWSGVGFAYGKGSIAKINFSGKTLCVYLAIDPALHQNGKYKVTDVSLKKSYASLPSKIKIRSAGALKAALSYIDALATDKGMIVKEPLPEPILAKHFPTDTFDNLLTRGLIRRIVETPKKLYSKSAAPDALSADNEPDAPKTPVEVEGDKIPFGFSDDAYKDTVASSDALILRHDEYSELLSTLKSGDLSVKMVRRYMLKSIDETWVKVIEDSLPALDEVVRNPSHFIEETEMLLPIERTKKVTSRSIQHLSQHTDLISKIDKDETVTPSKLLNVFREDSMMTYENKFVNTLLNRLFVFVTRRYDAAIRNGSDEKVTALEFSDEFVHGRFKGKIRLEIELTGETGDEKGVRNYASATDLFKRVKKLNDVAKNYQGSAFVLAMGKAFIRPPVMHTNPILKNKNLRQCLALWEFIESYDDKTGVIADQKEQEISQEQLTHIYESVAAQYLVFCHNVADAYAFDEGSDLPRELDEASEIAEEKPIFDLNGVHAEAGEEAGDEYLFAIKTALAADAEIEAALAVKEREERELAALAAEKAEEEEIRLAAERAVSDVSNVDKDGEEESDEEDGDETEEEVEFVSEKDGIVYKTIVRYRKSFAAKLRLSSDTVKEYYCAIYNKFLTRNKVRVRSSFGCDTFSLGRNQLAKMTVIGKTLRLYLALDPASLESKYFAKDVSDIKKYSQVPAMLKIRSGRGLKNALALVDRVLDGVEPKKGEPPFVTLTDFPTETIEKLVAMGLAFKSVKTIAVSEKAETKEMAGGERLIVKPMPLPFKIVREEETEDLTLPEPPEELSEEERKEFIEKAKARIEELRALKETVGKQNDASAPQAETAAEVPDDEETADTANEQTEEATNEQEIIDTANIGRTEEFAEAGGDPLLMKQDVVDSMQNIVLELPTDQKEETPAPQAEQTAAAPDEVPVGGDALLLKPITLEELENSTSKKTQVVTEESDEEFGAERAQEKKGFFSRIFGRKK